MSIRENFQHQGFSSLRRREVASETPAISEEDFAVYVAALKEKCKETLAALQAGNAEALLLTIESFINVFKPGVEVPGEVFEENGFFAGVLKFLVSGVENVRVVNELAWLLARVTFVSDVSIGSDNAVLRRLAELVKSVGDNPDLSKVWFLVANVGSWLPYLIDFWHAIPSLIPALHAANATSKAIMIFINNSCHHFICVNAQREKERFLAMMTQFLELIHGYVSMGSPESLELARMGLFFVGDMIRKQNPFPVTAESLAFLNQCAFCGNPLVMEPALEVLYFLLVRENELELDAAQIWQLAITENPGFEAVYYQASQLIRLYCEFHPEVAVRLNIIPYILAHCDDVPFRVQLQLRWIIADFLFFIDFGVAEEWAAANGIDTVQAIVNLVQFLMDGSSDALVSYLTIWALLGLKWAFARFSNLAAWETITGLVNLEDYIVGCLELQNSELDELVDRFVELDNMLDNAPALQASMAAIRAETAPQIRFVLGSPEDT